MTSSLPADVVTMLGDYLDEVSSSAHRALGQVGGVAVTLAVDDAGAVTAGASTQLARAVDEWQYRIGQGPCLTALSGGGGCYVPDLGSDTRWGEYGPGAASLGAKSCLSVPVVLDGRPRAVLKVYAETVDGLTEQQRRTGIRTATEIVGGIGLAQTLSRASAELRDRTEAMDARRIIDLALGILMERTSCDPDAAFDLLRRYSQQHNVKVRDVAAQLVSGSPTGGLGTDSMTAPFLPRGSAPAH